MRIRQETDAALLQRLYDEVLQVSFPVTELVARDAFVHATADSDYDVLVAMDGDRIAGAIVGERFDTAMLVAWLAVSASGRGGGTGSALLKAGASRWIGQPGIEIVLAEIERPDLFPAHPVHGDPARRLAFYARHGATALDLPYVQPPIAPGLPAVPGLLLIALASRTPLAAPRLLDPAETTAVRGFLRTTQSASDPAGRAVLDAAGAPGLRMVALPDYAVIALPAGSA